MDVLSVTVMSDRDCGFCPHPLNILIKGVVFTLSSFRSPEHKSAHLKFLSFMPQTLGRLEYVRTQCLFSPEIEHAI